MTQDETTTEGKGKPDDKAKLIPIHIDRDQFRVENRPTTGAELRALPEPPIGDDRSLYRVVPGGQDEKVENDTVVELKPGMHFVTAPKQVNPGAERGHRG